VSRRPAAFLDRDGTLIQDRHYLRDPSAMRLLPGVAEAIARLNRAGVAAVVVTNQSGIARGLLSEADYQAAVAKLDQLLEAGGARVDGHYHCPHLPEITGACDCRKPGSLLYRRAVDALGLDPVRSWWIGDRVRDVAGATAFGGQGVLVLTGNGPREARTPEGRSWPSVPDLAAAVELVLAALSNATR
jgi:D-glycero-D-manno-heptose 1,7-bisphosphate phosphatase